MSRWAICLALLPSFVFPAAAQQQPEFTHTIEMEPGFAARWTAPRPFASIIIGDSKVADAIPGQIDRVVVITSKTAGQTNLLMVDDKGEQVANLFVSVAPINRRESKKVAIHNKLDNLAGYTAYQCSPICVRMDDKLEGSDRVPPPRVVLQQPITVNAPPTSPPPPSQP
jgi:hypothetical protein